MERKFTHGMRSIRSLYKCGAGPSSSHTMGPEKAAMIFRERYPDATNYQAILFGSLALTGRGHGTDRVIRNCFSPKRAEIFFDSRDEAPPHPNTMELLAFNGLTEIGRMRIFSIGGGEIAIDGESDSSEKEVYPHRSFSETAKYCTGHNLRLWEYVEQMEGPEIWGFLQTVWEAMKRSIENGLADSGVLPGGLNVQRKAQYLYRQRHTEESPVTRENRVICAYAYAVSEENAGGGRVVTAPTCGSCGVLPAVLKYHQDKLPCDDASILHGLAAAGVIGNLIRTNASISGAECGCQAEIGSACSMAAAALAELYGMHVDQIEYAAEIAMEHHLGLTCDPIQGLVQIPCIERNAVAAMRAINAVSLAEFLTHTRKISFDLVVETMYETGRDMACGYKETSKSGLAKLYRNDS